MAGVIQPSLFEPRGDEGIQLRYYQREAIAAVEHNLKTHDSTLLVMATGTGKTITFSTIARDWPGRVLILAHRGELVRQTAAALERVTGEKVGVEQAGEFSRRERIVVGSVQTVSKAARADRLIKHGGYSLVITDEAHHYIARTYKKAATAFEGAKLIGATATPNRGDGKAMGALFDSVAYEFGLERSIRAGFLVPIHYRAVQMSVIDLSDVKKTKGDLNISELDLVMTRAVEGVCKTVLDCWPDSRGPAFFPKKRSAEYAANRFNQLKPGCAAVVTADTPDLERAGIIKDCLRGKIQYLCNCMVATEGFDWPDANIMIGTRPTLSTGLYTQMVGRVTRPAEGTIKGLDEEPQKDERITAIAFSNKPRCLVIDFVGNNGKHDIMSPVDILGGRFGEDAIKEAKKTLKDKKDASGEDVLQALRNAKDYLRRLSEKQLHEARYKVKKAKPLEIINAQEIPSFGDRPCTEGQRNYLKNMGLYDRELNEMSFAHASKLIADDQVRRKHHLATYKQVRTLKQWVPFTRYSMAAASKAIKYLASTGWGKTEPVDVNRLWHMLKPGRGTKK